MTQMGTNSNDRSLYKKPAVGGHTEEEKAMWLCQEEIGVMCSPAKECLDPDAASQMPEPDAFRCWQRKGFDDCPSAKNLHFRPLI